MKIRLKHKIKNWFISRDEHVSPFLRLLLAVGLLTFVSTMLYLCFKLIPENDTESVKIFTKRFNLEKEARLVFLVLISGSIGSSIHTITSFTRYIGHDKFYRRWIWWYLMRPFAGSSLALIFYFVLRGGLFTGNASSEINIYGVMALSGLVGMFSKQATDKLSELFNNLFSTEKKESTDSLTEEDKEQNRN